VEALTIIPTGSDEASGLRPGSKAPRAGVYVVTHSCPSHSSEHEVMIWVPIILPRCNKCADARFRYKAPLPIAIQHHKYFQPPFNGVGTLPVPGRWAR
jgi:hypothetical protein